MNNNDLIFYHGGVDSNFNIDRIDPFRLASKQNKRGRTNAGFYMYGESDLEGAKRYANMQQTPKGVAKISIDNSANILDYDGSITRIPQETLKNLQEQGYDVLRGKPTFETLNKVEYVLLNKDKINSIDFMSLDENGNIKDINKTYIRQNTTISNSFNNQNNSVQDLKNWYKKYTKSSENVINQKIDLNRKNIINQITSSETSKGFTGHISQPVKLSDLTQKEHDLFKAYETELEKIGYKLDDNIIEFGNGAGVQRKIIPTKNAVTDINKMHEILFEGRDYDIGNFKRKPEFINQNEQTRIEIDSNGEGVRTETSSTGRTKIPDSSTNQNNAEKIKQQEPINNPEKPDKPERKQEKKPERKTNNSNHNKKPPETATTPETKPHKPVDTVEIPKTETPKVEKPKTQTPNQKYRPKKAPKLKSNTVNVTKEQIENAIKQAGMKTKNITEEAAKAINWGKVGKIGAVVGVAALVGTGIHKHNKKEKNNRKNGPDRLTGYTRKSEYWNQSYAAQMAKDISTYQYGKRMTGFVQG